MAEINIESAGPRTGPAGIAARHNREIGTRARVGALIERQNDKDRTYRISYGELLAPIVKSIQEQQQEIEAERQQNADLSPAGNEGAHAVGANRNVAIHGYGHARQRPGSIRQEQRQQRLTVQSFTTNPSRLAHVQNPPRGAPMWRRAVWAVPINHRPAQSAPS